MAQYGTWVPYGGGNRIVLAAVLLVVASGAALAGARLPLPARAARPGRAVTVFLLAAWALALASFLVALAAYAGQVNQEGLGHALPADPIAPVTGAASLIVFCIIMTTGPPSFWAKIISGVTAAAAGPVIFELPFDLIVMGRTFPPLPPHPDLYPALFFAPFFVVLLVTLSLLTLSPMVKLSPPLNRPGESGDFLA
jgi:hypothetical protein